MKLQIQVVISLVRNFWLIIQLTNLGRKVTKKVSIPKKEIKSVSTNKRLTVLEYSTYKTSNSTQKDYFNRLKLYQSLTQSVETFPEGFCFFLFGDTHTRSQTHNSQLNLILQPKNLLSIPHYYHILHFNDDESNRSVS